MLTSKLIISLSIIIVLNKVKNHLSMNFSPHDITFICLIHILKNSMSLQMTQQLGGCKGSSKNGRPTWVWIPAPQLFRKSSGEPLPASVKMGVIYPASQGVV